MDRQYNIHEIDALRAAVRNKYLWGSYRPPNQGGSSRSYKEDEMARVVEEEVRTLMIAGLTADELG